MTLHALVASGPLLLALVAGAGQEPGAPETPPGMAPTVVPVAVPATPAPDDWEAKERVYLDRIRDLERELRDQQRTQIAREQEWLEYTRVLNSFRLPSLPEPPEFIAEALRPAPDPVAEAEARAAAERRRRGQEILRELDALLIAESVGAFGLLETGSLHEHEGRTVVGPVIARILDERGRMIGMLKAEHMRLETSRSARSVTIVLEDGYESRGGQVTPFEGGGFAVTDAFDPDGNPLRQALAPGGGVRRIFLGSVDPEPWIETLPDLVDARSLEPVVDDGLWDVNAVRGRLSRMLRESSEAGDVSWQLAGLGGVRNGELRDVQFLERGGFGGTPRRVFADVCRIRPGAGDRGIELTLEGGTVRRGNRLAPFLNGRYRIVLPRADLASWRAARIPGLSVPRVDAPQ